MRYLSIEVLRRGMLLAMIMTSVLCLIFPAKLSEMVLPDTNLNTVLDWEDSYTGPNTSCELEPTGSSISSSKHHHLQHIPKLCHELIADELFSSAKNTEQISHAAYHQIMSGKGFRYNSLFTVWRSKWKNALQIYEPELVLKEAVEEARKTAKGLYNKDGKTLNSLSWQITTAEDDMELFSGIGNNRAYRVLPATLMILIVFFLDLFRRFW